MERGAERKMPIFKMLGMQLPGLTLRNSETSAVKSLFMKRV